VVEDLVKIQIVRLELLPKVPQVEELAMVLLVVGLLLVQVQAVVARAA
jgi:hypothetical protein